MNKAFLTVEGEKEGYPVKFKYHFDDPTFSFGAQHSSRLPTLADYPAPIPFSKQTVKVTFEGTASRVDTIFGKSTFFGRMKAKIVRFIKYKIIYPVSKLFPWEQYPDKEEN